MRKALERETEERWIRRAQAGEDRAVERLLWQYAPLVEKLAKRRAAGDHELEDLRVIGTCGLWKAVMKFDFRPGVKFMTVAVRFIAYEMGEERYIVDVRRKVRIAAARIESRTGRRATAEEIAQELGATVSSVQLALSAESLARPIRFVPEPESLASLPKGCLSETSVVAPESLSDLPPEVRLDLLEAMGDFTERELRLIAGTIDGATLKEKGMELGITGERARQIEKRATEKLAARLSVMWEMNHFSVEGESIAA